MSERPGPENQDQEHWGLGVAEGMNSQNKNPLWYKSAVIYEVHVRAFYDSNGDGTGDFPGLTAKLDYLRSLGVTAIWLLPFYPSPLKDDGYDIADYYGVHPQYGTLGDFKVFLREAHKRELRVIIELVINHTSDQHPWFQRARRAKAGSRRRNYYVWSDSAERYKGVRVIFKDTEISNWTWDAVAKAYYWHRFYGHQPDLNFEHPAVHEEVLHVLDFWLRMGVDGVRLDAVPYLYEREGTSCENLPETHQFLKMLRRHVDEKYGDRMLLGEANQWPEDAAAYFGTGRGDECHMAFHFPLMPRLFMSLRMEDRVPITDIMQQTPAIPETAQWALFLRNHDELTLEMVTDEERDYMYRVYANVPQSRLNLGIRRRLAPLVGNDRRRIELLSALLFSLPGTPVMYYGDEIGMGENIFLGDRNGVRTPMQWSADKNAGFSRANPQGLYLPINLDPGNHFEAVNVEVQEGNRHSLLWWMKRLIALRKQWNAFGLGTLEFLLPDNRKILAFVRRHENECILVVANLSRFVQPVELNLAEFAARLPIELFGRTEFPAISEKPYFLTLGPHAFYWFSLEAKPAAQSQSTEAPGEAAAKPEVALAARGEELFEARRQFELEKLLQQWLPTRSWYAGRGRSIRRVSLRDLIPVPAEPGGGYLALVEVVSDRTEPDLYLLPLALASGKTAEKLCQEWLPLVVARLRFSQTGEAGVLYDALANPEFCRELLELISTRRVFRGRRGELRGTHTAVLRRLRMEKKLDLEPSPCKVEQSNTSVIFGDQLVLKCFRRQEEGENPEVEVSRFLTERKFPHAPLLAGALEYYAGGNPPSTVAMLTTYIADTKDAWEYTMDTLSRFYERIQILPEERRKLSFPAASGDHLSKTGVPDEVAEMIGTYLQSARQLGERTASLHLALASDASDPTFAPEPFTLHYQRGLFQSMRNEAGESFHLLGERLKNLPPQTQEEGRKVLRLQDAIIARYRGIYAERIGAWRIRCHGDYHLGEALYTGKDFIIIDFEGAPEIALGERRIKRSPLVDVASMIRSFHYVAHAALLAQVKRGTVQPEKVEEMEPWSRFWSAWVSAAFYQGYRQTVGAAAFMPASEAETNLLLDCFGLRKAIEQLAGELARRPDWAPIPLRGILELMASPGSATTT
jgi:maltose alpha-D-glucosyltransferase/alpha-amylase